MMEMDQQKQPALCNMTDSLIWCWKAGMLRQTHPYYPHFHTPRSMGHLYPRLVNLTFEEIFGENGSLLSEMNPDCVQRRPEETFLLPWHYLWRGAGWAFVRNRLQNLWPPNVPANAFEIEQTAIAYIMFLFAPMAYVSLILLNGLLLIGFHRLHVRQAAAAGGSRRHRSFQYIHQASLSLADFVSMNVHFLLIYVRFLNVYTLFPCWFHGMFPWRSLNAALCVLGPCQLLGVTVDRFDAFWRPEHYGSCARHGLRAAVINGVSYGAVALATAFLHIYNPVYSRSMETPHDVRLIRGERIENVYRHPLRFQQNLFCQLFIQDMLVNATFPPLGNFHGHPYQPRTHPCNRTQSNIIHPLRWGSEWYLKRIGLQTRPTRIDMRLLCPLIDLRNGPNAILIFFGFLSVLTLLLLLSTIGMISMYRYSSKLINSRRTTAAAPAAAGTRTWCQINPFIRRFRLYRNRQTDSSDIQMTSTTTPPAVGSNQQETQQWGTKRNSQIHQFLQKRLSQEPPQIEPAQTSATTSTTTLSGTSDILFVALMAQISLQLLLFLTLMVQLSRGWAERYLAQTNRGLLDAYNVLSAATLVPMYIFGYANYAENFVIFYTVSGNFRAELRGFFGELKMRIRAKILEYV